MDPLLSVDDALAAVLAHVPPALTERAALVSSVGSVLAEEVRADHDHPPFPRSRVDGWAVRRADLAAGAAKLRIAATIPAGAAPGASLGPGEAARIFTGAAVPDGADAVAMQERCELVDAGSAVRVPAEAATADHIVPRGAECAIGALVARRGDLITPALVGAVAAAGVASAPIFRAPRVRVVATGDELVPCEEMPGPGRIRNSNAPALAAAALACGATVEGTRRAPDTMDALTDALGWALGGEIALVTGGVSVGDFDLVPKVLDALGARRVLHGVRLQPGKPLWFGVFNRTLVFGLPGNPVSALVNTALFVRPAVARLRGLAGGPASFPATLGGAVGAGAHRRRYVPVGVRRDGAGFVAGPVPFRGSGDLFGFSRAQALVVVPEDAPARAAGEQAECVPLFEPLP